MNCEEVIFGQLLLEKNMIVGALEGLAKFASDHLSKETIELVDLGALHGLIYGIQLMAETHSDNLDKYEVAKIQTKLRS